MEETSDISTPEEPTVMRVDEIAISTRGGVKRQRDKEDGMSKDKRDSGEYGTTALARDEDDPQPEATARGDDCGDEDDQRPEATAGGGGGETTAASLSKKARRNHRQRVNRARGKEGGSATSS